MTALRRFPLEHWRDEASRLGGLPREHPDVPSGYVYTANRLVWLIDALMDSRLAEATEAANELARGAS